MLVNYYLPFSGNMNEQFADTVCARRLIDNGRVR